MRMVLPPTFACLCCLLFASAGRADIIQLKGGELEGEIIGKENGRVRIRTVSGIVTSVPEGDVVAVNPQKTPLDIYRAMAEKAGKDDADGHFALAMWCRDHRLRDQMATELAATLRINPDHEGARAELGQVKTGQGWMSHDDAMRAKGMVLVGGRWLTKDEAERLENEEKNRKLLQAVNAMVYKIHTLSKAGAKEWEEKLGEVDDPSMAPKVRTLLEDADAGVRRAACASLAAMQHHDGVPLVVACALTDSDDSVRDAAVAALCRLDRARARGAVYDVIDGLLVQRITTLREQKSIEQLYYRAAVVLGAVGDLNSIPYLIQILYAKVEISAGTGAASGGMVIGIYRPSGTGVDESGMPTGVTFGLGQPAGPEGDTYYFNSAAEEALKKLTGQNLGVMPRDWQVWWDNHGSELLRKAEAGKRAGRERAEQLLDKAP